MLVKNKALGVDIGDDAIRLVALRARGTGYEVVDVQEIPLPEECSPDAMAQALSQLTDEARTRVAIALPASGCAFKTSLLPPAKPADLAQVLKFEAESQFPIPLDDLTWSYTLSKESSGRMSALLVGARRSLVEERLRLAQCLGIEPTALLVAPLAAAEAIVQPAGTYLLVVAGTEWCDLCLFEHEQLQGCRSILAGSPTEEGWAERLAREIRPWAQSSPPTRVVALGAVSPKAAAALEQLLGLPVTLGDPWVDVLNAPDFRADAAGASTAFATAIGLAKAALGRKPEINLLPQQVTDARRQGRKSAQLLTGLALVIALLAPCVYMTGQTLHTQREQLAAQTTPSRPLAPQTTSVQGDLTTAQQAIDALAKPESNPLEVLRLLSEQLPPGITLTNLAYDRGKMVVMKGRATSNTVLASAMSALTQMGVVTHVMLNYSNQVKETDGQGYDFQISATLPPTTDPTSAAKRKTATKQTETTVVQ
ncbi:MAG TPA: pilus assembly protein PilM [Armatimonadota bacterium]|jgi:type II secretory pathway component PulL